MDDTTLARAGRRTTAVMFAVQSLGSAGVIAVATVATIAGAELSGRTALAGVPGATFQAGAALSAVVWSLLSDRLGRRGGFSLGLFTGAVGAAAAIAAVAAGSFTLLVIALVVMGSGQAATRLGRFAAAEAAPPRWRGRAVATVVLGGTVGSVLGPTAVAPATALFTRLGVDGLAGPYAVGMAMYLLSALGVWVLLRPDPRELGEAIERRYPHPHRAAGPARRWGALLRDRGVVAAMVAMIASQAVMVMLMGITSLHMKLTLHSLASISVVFSAHTFGMFAPSLATGWLADRFGRRPVIAAGTVLLLAACLTAPLSDATPALVGALFLLGLGWNLCYVGGSALLADRLTPAEKGRTQGVNDLVMGGVAASASLGAGMLFAVSGYGAIGIGGAVMTALLALGLILTARAPAIPAAGAGG